MVDPPVHPDAPTWTSTPVPHGDSASEVPTWLPGPATLPHASALGGSSTSGSCVDGSATHDPAASDARPTLAVGTIIDGDYRVEGVIGKGAMGVVYRAHHIRLDRPVALKLQRTMGDDTARLDREARAMARLDHPNVVGVYDVGMHGRDVYIAMEFVDGCSLRAWLAAGPRPWRQALDVCLQAGRGIMAAHAAGIVHRDLKPDNVLVGNDGRVRVADFGIARGIAAPATEATFETTSLGPDLTRTGAMPGTPAYMAPEQFEGRADARSDVFAFSVMLYEALWGARPFGGSTLAELVHNLMRGKIRAVPAASPVPPEVIRAVLGGLAIDPRMRTASMMQLLAELERAKVPRRSTAALGVAIGVAAIVAVAAVGTTAWWFLRPTPSAPVVAENVITPPVDDAAPPPPPPPPPPAEVAAVTPPPVDLDEAKRAGKRALVDLMQGKVVDPEALDGLLEVDNGDIISATLAGVMMMDAEARADEGGFHRPKWDGTDKLLCKMGDKFRFEKETFKLEGTAFTTMYGCQLQLIDCDITADVIAQVMLRSEILISGGTMHPRIKVLDQMHGVATIAGTTIEGTPPIGFDITGGTLNIADTTVNAATAISADAKAVVNLVGGRLEGSTAALDASGGATITVDQTEIVGPTKLRNDATLQQAEKAEPAKP